MVDDRNKADWSNYWQGRTAGEVGDALVGNRGVGIEHSSELERFWAGVLDGFERDISMIDLACGAGSVLRHAHRLGFTNLSGIDISKDAISAMQAAIPGAHGIVGPVDNMPLKAGKYDLVVSQFGFEYAGSNEAVLNTAKEIVRISKSDGGFIGICHFKDGGIDREVRGHLRSIDELEATGFVQASKNLFKSLFTAQANPTEQTQSDFQLASDALAEPRQTLSTWIERGPTGDEQIKQLGQHLLQGAADLYARRQAYALEDIIGWLDGMQAEIDAYKGRMASMRSAALDEQTCEKILNVFKQAGSKTITPMPLYFGDETVPAAWILKAGPGS